MIVQFGLPWWLSLFDLDILLCCHTIPFMLACRLIVPPGTLHNLPCKTQGLFHVFEKIFDRSDINTVFRHPEHKTKPPFQLHECSNGYKPLELARLQGR